MNPISWLYLKIFLILGLGYGILMSLADILFGNELQLSQFLIRTILFGFSMSSLLVSVHVFRLRKEGVKKFTNEILSPIQKRSIISSLSNEQLIKEIATDPVLGKLELKQTEKELILQSDMSLFSYGNQISIQIYPAKGILNHYKILSKPRLKSTMLDYGTSYSQVSHLEKLLMEGNSTEK